jgi:hypothetical protein
MTNPTSNFGWQMPTSTDLVTDLPADFEVFGQAVDTSLADLKGGTTGQVLKKNTNADMDFVWSADAAGMTNPMTTTGDTIYSSSGSTPARLGIGTTGQVLTVASGVPSWATPSGGPTGWSLLNSGSTSLPSSSSVTFSGLSSKRYLILLQNVSSTIESFIGIQFNSDTGNNYAIFGGTNINSDPWSPANLNNISQYAFANFRIGRTTGSGYFGGSVLVDLADQTGWKNIIGTGSGYDNITNGAQGNYCQGVWKGSAAITSITIILSGGTFDGSSVAYILGAS